MDAAMVTLGVLAVAAFLFATELIPLAVTAIGAAISLGLLGVLTPKEVFAGLSNSTVVLFAGMFIIGAAMFQTGVAQKIGIAVVKKSGTNERSLMAAIMLITIVLSAVSSNTATVACLMPVVVQMCAAAKVPVGPQLMGLAVAANVGGTITRRADSRRSASSSLHGLVFLSRSSAFSTCSRSAASSAHRTWLLCPRAQLIRKRK